MSVHDARALAEVVRVLGHVKFITEGELCMLHVHDALSRVT
jgi:hypothetical protein